MIVVDASAALAALLNAGAARDVLAAEQLHAPHLVDAEVANALRRRAAADRRHVDAASRALDTWRRLGLSRHPVSPLLPRVWELREDLSAYDACYVALAESLRCALLTADARLSRAPGVRCPLSLVPGWVPEHQGPRVR